MPLNVITLGWTTTDNIKQMITIIKFLTYKYAKYVVESFLVKTGQGGPI
jgi:hypothetical protein